MTELTFRPAYLLALLRAHILLLPEYPADVQFREGVVGTFPVTGGAFDQAAMTGSLAHDGGHAYVGMSSGRSIRLVGPVIHFDRGVVNARVDDDDPMVSVYTFEPSQVLVVQRDRKTWVTGLGIELTGHAAEILNARLDTSLFARGMDVGDVSSPLSS